MASSSSSFIDIFRSRKLSSLLLLGFASGLPAQALDGPLQLWLKEQKVDIAQITAIGALATLPYALKFIWSPFLDRFVPPFLGRRRGWLLLTQVILIVLLLLMSAQNPSSSNLQAFTAIAVLIGFFSASQDIASDAYRTDVLNKDDNGIKGTGVALWVNGFRIAVLIAGNWILGLADVKNPNHLSWNAIYIVMAGLLGLGVIASLFAPQPAEENVVPASMLDAIVLPFQDFFQRKTVLGGTAILLYILVYKLGDYMVKSVSKLFFKDVGFSVTDIGNFGAMGVIASIVGALAGAWLMSKVSMNRALWLSIILLAVGTLPYVLLAQINQPDTRLLLLAINAESFFAGLEALVFVVFIQNLCNQQFTATQMALFTSFMLAGRSFITGPMGGVAKSLGWTNFFWFSILAAIPGLILMTYIAPWNEREAT
jgi:MFS transporter, PAT family, beta-lactamase induction signal transducer AmpG